MIKTAQLRSLLSNYKDLLAADEFASFEEEVERLLVHYGEMLSDLAPGEERGRKVHALINEQEQQSSHIKTTCQKGCGACCHLEVEITRDDAIILANSLKDGLELDVARLRELSLRERLDSAWAQGWVVSNRCVFLGPDNACRNYENRPSVCRKHSVVSPVIECQKWGGKPVPKVMPMAEIIMSAAANQTDNDFASLPKMLQRELDCRQIEEPALPLPTRLPQEIL
ncbi:YkgJ family cysteine cluster protein [Bdellovibrio sp. KM01]|uniref:YkgJ family cysteine cluster protein n=1 Tax=Bdellovibrio sp. KM01 TaxID=2748865 RepID=UPI0015E9B367|nr:YkgJ family cysteine cluster protein [Bdellovibrio sp. KM01]QLY24725.1 YkgJ family cysteine cluster protein [Bdellovibrio sp. KM01]